ncbi:MAG: YmdB family metallophosphoesterase [Phycisphaerales bacterium]|nr:YmdB family metallophosphoesterase [Phycisphaerales bacterium]
MPELVIAFLGDVVGGPGRSAIEAAVPVLRQQHKCQLIIVNGENARHGSGLSPDNYRSLIQRRGAVRDTGVDAVTLGDHAFRERAILPILKDPAEPVARPANLSLTAPGKRIIRLMPPGGESPPLYILTVLGRLFMPIPADSPFAAIDRELSAIPEPNAIVIVEAHAEATSEKQALAWHCLDKWSSPSGPRVVAVVGTHTHTQTADARILDRQMAAMTDLGMCGPHRSVIGRSISATLEAMVNQTPTPLDVASDDVRAQGCIMRIDAEMRRPIAIDRFDLAV